MIYHLFHSDGNLSDIREAGSLMEYVIDLHGKYGQIVSFWLGKQYTVSIASPELFKEHSHIFDRPRKYNVCNVMTTDCS